MSTLDSPITRQEMYLSYLNGNKDITLPEPITRIERYLYALCVSGGGGAISGNIISIAKQKIEGGTRVTFTYVLENGAQEKESIDIMDGKNGANGHDGQDGTNGADGFSPTIIPDPDNTKDDYRLKITDITGTHTTDNLIGAKGKDGAQGIRGEKGEQGERGVQGEQGPQGIQGDPFLVYKEYQTLDEFNPSDFKAVGQMFGIKEPEIGTYDVYRYAGGSDYTFITSLGLSESIKGEQGPQGIQGVAGKDGADGTTYTPTIGTVKSGTNAGASIDLDENKQEFALNLVLPKGEKGERGPEGPQGPPGEGSVDLLETIEELEANTTEGKSVDALLVKEINGSLKPNLLWENPSPDAAFASQTITLSSSDYDALLIFYRYGSNNIKRCMNTIMLKGYDGFLDVAQFQSGTISNVFRTITRNDDTSFTLGDTSLVIGSSVTTNNNLIVPLKIYGIKF